MKRFKFITKSKHTDKTSTSILFFYLFLFLNPIVLKSQVSEYIDEILVKEFQKISKKQSTERVYLQTSKGIYETSEDLWFKAYVLNSQFLLPSTRSKTLFIQFVNEESNKPVWQEKYVIENGFVDGHIYIQDTLASGNYRLEAYTPNSYSYTQQEFTSLKKLKIVKDINKGLVASVLSKNLKSTNNETINLAIFPEGGYLVSNLQSSVGFKATNQKGFPVNVSGTVYENGKPIVNFKSTHAGMGGFLITPDKTKKYHIILDDSLSTKKVELPSIKNKGKVLQLISNSKDALIFKIAQSQVFLKETIYIRLQIRGVVYGIAEAVIENKEIMVKIPLKDVPRGLAEVTLFNEHLNAVAERLVFIHQDQKLFIKTALNKEQYRTKDKVQLKLKVTDQSGQPVIAHLALSVYDQIYNHQEDSKTIESHFLLSSDIRGSLYHPSYYFDDKNKNRKRALNLLLLTQGWRAYVWNEENLKEKLLQKKIGINDTVKGHIYGNNKKSNLTLAQHTIMMFTAEKNSPKSFIQPDSLGYFKILPENIQQAKKGYLYLKPLMSNSKSKISIHINDLTFHRINQDYENRKVQYPILKMTSKQMENLANPFRVANNLNNLDEVTVTAKSKQSYRDKYIGSLDSLMNVPVNYNYVCHNGISNCKNHVPEWIKSTRSKGKYTEEELLKIFNTKRIKGYYPKKVFYEPVYNIEEQVNGFPDFRNTLYWKPAIITDTNGEATIRFFCSDINTKFIGVIEGVSGEGLLGSTFFEFQVLSRKR